MKEKVYNEKVYNEKVYLGVHKNPKNYHGTRTTTYQMKDLLSLVFSKISAVYDEHPEILLNAWPEIIGLRLSSMTEALSFCDGILTIKVKNSMTLELLRRERSRIQTTISQKFPKANIKSINFRIG